MLIGRGDKGTFQILDPRVSRNHMQIKRNTDGIGHAAIDHQSSNGVLVNGQRIAGEQPMNDGDAIHIGETEFVYSTIDSSDAQTVSAILRKRGEHMRGTIAES